MSALALLVLVACAGRVTRGPDQVGASREIRVAPGDVIRVVTKQRQRYSLAVTAVQPDAFAGRTVQRQPRDTVVEGAELIVPFADLALLELSDPQKSRDEAKSGGIAVVTLATYVIGVLFIPVGI